MSKELEALERIKLGYICGQGAINEFALKENERENFKIIEKALKALEIISNIRKHTNHFWLGERYIGVNQMSYYLIIDCERSQCKYKLKGKEEYDLLKEVLI